MAARWAAHRALVVFRAWGAVPTEELLSSEARFVTEFGDPLATGPEDVARLSRAWKRAITPFGATRVERLTATQAWEAGWVRGTSQLTMNARGVVEHRLMDVRVAGRRLDGKLLREVVLRLADYDAVAEIAQRTVKLLVPEFPPEPLPAAEGSLEPDADALGLAGFETYDRQRRAKLALLEHLPRALEEPPPADLFAPDVRVVGLAGDVIFSDREQLLRALKAVRGARALAPGETYTVDGDECTSVNFRYELGPLRVDLSIDYEFFDARVSRATIAELAVNDRAVKPSALARFIARELAVPTPPQKRRSAEDAAALVSLAAALHEGLVDALADAEKVDAFAAAAGFSDRVTVRGILGERLLEGRRDLATALKAASRLQLPVPALRATELTKTGDLKATLRFADLLTVVCVFEVANGVVTNVAIADLQGVALPETLRRARDLLVR